MLAADGEPMTQSTQTQIENNLSPAQLPEQKAALTLVTGILGIFGITAGLIFLYFGIRQLQWQFFVVSGAFFFTGVPGLIGLIRVQKGIYAIQELGWFSLVFVITLFVTTSLIEGVALPSAITFLIFSLTLTSITATGGSRGTMTIILGLVFSSMIALVGTFFTVFQITFSEINVIIPSLLSIVIMIYITLLVVQFISAPLQTRLASAFLAVVIVPLSITSLIQNQASLNRIRTETFQSLSATANEVTVVLDKYINNNLDIIRQEADMDAFSQYLSASPGTPESIEAERQMQIAVRLLETRESEERKALSSYALLDIHGQNLYDTDKTAIGKFETQDYFFQPVNNGRPYFSSVIFDDQGNGWIYFSAPIKDRQRVNIIGVLRARYNALVFQRLATNYSGLLGLDSYVIIIDENMIRLADSYKPTLVYSAMDNLSAEQVNTLKIQGRLPILSSGPSAAVAPELTRLLRLTNPAGTASLDIDKTSSSDNLPEMVAFSTMTQAPWKTIYLKANYDQRPIETQQSQTAILIAALVSLVVGLISIGTSRILANPITSLTRTAHRISAGDITTQAELSGNDEFGTLGAAFNLMTARMRSFIVELEDRVNLRTQELKQRNEILVFRSNQLRTVAEVARSIVTSQELEELLDSITILISSRFGFYHVGVFLVDERREFAVLRAANSEGGKRMLARHHALKVGRVGIVGFVTGTGEPRIASDVGEDATFFNNPDLPLTRSEMALPLRVGDEIIGALDVQSTEPDSFTLENIELFSTLADQVSIAIYNNRLYNETARALADAESTHRRYLQQEWSSELITRQVKAYRYTPQELAPADLPNEEIADVLATGKPTSQVESQPDGTTRLVMTVPILLRGETIGVIRVQDQGNERTWSEDELLSVQDIAQQVGMALETTRLFEKTVLRAERERKVLEITSRIRSTNDPQEMLAIAAAELQKALGATRAQITLRQPTSTSPNRGNQTVTASLDE
jgi:GAF domain-containing protein/HAMP domain-containing protein